MNVAGRVSERVRRNSRRILQVTILTAVFGGQMRAQILGLNVGNAPSTRVLPDGKLTVPVIVDLSNAGAANIAALSTQLSWGATRLTFDSVRAVTALGWSFSSDVSGAALGALTFATSNGSPLVATSTLANVYFTASSTPGGTRIIAKPASALNASAGSVFSLLLPRAQDICVAQSGKWGDATNDDAVNIVDAQQIARFSVGLSVADQNSLTKRGDVTANLSVDIIDAQQIARFSVGLSAAARTGNESFVPPVTASATLTPGTQQNLVVGDTLSLRVTPRDGAASDLTGCSSFSWTSTNTSVAIVSGSGFLRALSIGSTTITATSITNPSVVVSVGVTVGAAGPSSVTITAVTVGCSAIVFANPSFQGTCGLNTGVDPQNTFGDADVRVGISRPPNSGITGVRLEIFNAPDGTAVGPAEETFTQTLIGESGTGNVIFSVPSAAYTIAGNVATPRHPNGAKLFRVTLMGAGGPSVEPTATAQQGLTLVNANGFHVTTSTNLTSGANANSICGANAASACPIAALAPSTGLIWNGGTSLAINAIAVVYTTQANHPLGFNGVLANGSTVGFGSACDASGTGTRTLAGTVGGGGRTVAGTLPYTNGGAATASNLSQYQLSAACVLGGALLGTTGEIPFATGFDQFGNPLINVALTGTAYGTSNTLNSPFGAVMPLLPTAPVIRLDNGGPAPIAGYATGRNAVGGDRCFGLWLNTAEIDGSGAACSIPSFLRLGGQPAGVSINGTAQAAFVANRTARINGWVNDAVNFGAVHSLAASAAGSTISASLLDANGAVAPTPTPQVPPFNTTGLPPDGGVGGNVSFVARIGACSTVVTCALMQPRTTTFGMAETNTGFELGAIVQSVDAFGNVTNPPSTGANFALVANPLDPVRPYVMNGVLFIGIDRTIPNVTSRGAGGSNTPGTTFTPNTIQGTSAANFDFVANDPVPAGLFGASGILFQLPGSELYVNLSRRDPATIQYFCPPAFNYLPFGNGCQSPVTTALGWNDGGVMYARSAGSILSDPTAGAVRAYYWAFVFSRDQAGNQSNGVSRNFIFDNTPPVSFGQTFAPAIFPANGPLMFTGNAVEDLDLGRAAFAIRFPSLSVAGGSVADFIRFPWAVKADVNSLSNPVGYNAVGPSALALQFTTTWPSAIRSIEVVRPGDNAVGPTIAGACAGCGGFTIGALPGEIEFPGGLNGGGVPIAFVQDGNLPNGAGPTQFNFFAQSVSRVGLQASAGPVGTVQNGQGTALTFAETGMPNTAATPASWTVAQASGASSPVFNMQWAIINPVAANLDLSGNASGGSVNAKTITAVAFFPNGAPVASPFGGGVRFYAIDIRQPLNVDNAGNVAAGGQPGAAGIGAALVEIPCAVSAASAGPTWQYQCVYNPSSGGTTSMLVAHDFAGFNFPSSASLMVNYASGAPVAGPVPNQGFWGASQIGPASFGFNQGWQGSPNVTAITPGTVIAVIAIGCNGTGNCLATRASTNAGFSVQP